jgi:hypothetical protein
MAPTESREENMQKGNDQVPREESTRSTELDNRYRKIGISAVAAAVRHQGPAQPAPRDGRPEPYDRD